jgi:hypothetical protein
MKHKPNYIRRIKVPPIGFNLYSSSGVQWCNSAKNKPITAEFDSQGSNKEGCVLTEKQTMIQTCESAANPVVICTTTSSSAFQKGGNLHGR